MYGWIFRHLPGPVWVKTILATLIILGIIYFLFEYVYPDFHSKYFDNTVG